MFRSLFVFFFIVSLTSCGIEDGKSTSNSTVANDGTGSKTDVTSPATTPSTGTITSVSNPNTNATTPTSPMGTLAVKNDIPQGEGVPTPPDFGLGF